MYKIYYHGGLFQDFSRTSFIKVFSGLTKIIRKYINLVYQKEKRLKKEFSKKIPGLLSDLPIFQYAFLKLKLIPGLSRIFKDFPGQKTLTKSLGWNFKFSCEALWREKRLIVIRLFLLYGIFSILVRVACIKLSIRYRKKFAKFHS